MKSKLFGLGVVWVLIAACSSQSYAAEAKCGDTRKIARSASSNEYIEACFDHSIAQGQVIANALRAAIDRISKFDSECVGKAGGRIVSTGSLPRANSKVAWRARTETHCETIYTHSRGSQQICTQFELPNDPYCVVSANAEVVHQCVCD